MYVFRLCNYRKIPSHTFPTLIGLLAISVVSTAGAFAWSDPDQGRPQTGVVYFHPNHIGSSALTTDEHGRFLASFVYEPFGTIHRASSQGPDTVRPKFTGKELDADTQLYYFEARYYDPHCGRFTTADRGLGAPIAHPAALHRYAYSANNPINVTDPSGRRIDIGSVPEDMARHAAAPSVPEQPQAPAGTHAQVQMTPVAEEQDQVWGAEFGFTGGGMGFVVKEDGSVEITWFEIGGSAYAVGGGGSSISLKQHQGHFYLEIAGEVGIGAGGEAAGTGVEVVPVGIEVKVVVDLGTVEEVLPYLEGNPGAGVGYRVAEILAKGELERFDLQGSLFSSYTAWVATAKVEIFFNEASRERFEQYMWPGKGEPHAPPAWVAKGYTYEQYWAVRNYLFPLPAPADETVLYPFRINHFDENPDQYVNGIQWNLTNLLSNGMENGLSNDTFTEIPYHDPFSN